MSEVSDNSVTSYIQVTKISLFVSNILKKGGDKLSLTLPIFIGLGLARTTINNYTYVIVIFFKDYVELVT